MKALHFDGTRMRYRTDYPAPIRGAGEALIRVRSVGICRTDREIAKGYMGFTGVPGHEFCGAVIEADTADLVGAMVCGDINLACRRCDDCRMSNYHHCPNRTVLGIDRKDGAMAEYLTLPEGNLFVIPPVLDQVRATFVEPLAAALEIVHIDPLSPDLPVLVIGDGILAYLIVGVIALRGNRITLSGKHEDKMRIFRERYPLITIVERRSMTASSGRFPIVIEASGTPDGFALAIDRCRPLGRLFVKSTYAGTLTIDFNRIVVDEITVVGTRCGPFEPSISLLAQGLIDPLPFVEGVVSLAEAAEVLNDTARSPKKIIIDPSR